MNSEKRDVRSDFTDVDRASDPGHLVRFLNTVSALEVIRAYKRRSFDVLALLHAARTHGCRENPENPPTRRLPLRTQRQARATPEE